MNAFWRRSRPVPAHQPADRLPEEQLGDRGGRVDPDPQPRDVDALGDHPDRHDPRVREVAKSAIRSLASGSSEVTTTARTPCRWRSSRATAWACSTSMVMASHRQPPAAAHAAAAAARAPGPAPSGATRRRRTARSGAAGRPRCGRGRRRRSRTSPSRRGRPLHLPAEPREEHGPHDPAVTQRVAVAVDVVGDRLVRLDPGLVVGRSVGHEGDRVLSLRNGVPDSESRRAADSKAHATPSPQARSAPAWWSSSRTTKASSDGPRSAFGGRDLLVGDGHAVHVRREGLGGRPARTRGGARRRRRPRSTGA
jgi:hypothetical protein